MADKKSDVKTATTNGGDTKTTSTGGTPDVTTTTTPDFGKELAELKKTISEQGEQLTQQQQAILAASIISNTIASDPVLKGNFEAALKKQYGGVPDQQPTQNTNQNTNNPTNQNPNSPVAQIEKDVKEVKETSRNQIIADFERETGINNLPENERKDARVKVANYLGSFGWTIDTLPVTNLRESLDKAFVGSIGVDRAREEGKVEALTSYRNNEKGVMGSFSGANQQTEEETALNAKQQAWLKKLNVDPEKAKKVVADQANEQTRERTFEPKSS